MVDISMPDVLYLNTNNLPSYSQGLYQNKDHLEIPRNSVYMLSSYQTEWPYSDKFISIIRDDNGRYHLVNHNMFVDLKSPLFKQEKNNYVYQDVIPLITYNEWLKVVRSFKTKRSKKYLDVFKKHNNWRFLFEKNTDKISFNQAFQLFRFLEISSDEDFRSFLTNQQFSLKPGSDWNWKLWNGGLNKINAIFGKFQNKLIYNGFIKNLKFYKLNLKFNINELDILIGRIDGRYGGVISINYCYPEKYTNFWNDYRKFKKSNIVSLPLDEIPDIFKLPKEPFTIFNKNTLDVFKTYIDKSGKKKREGFFNKESEKFQQFISSPNKAMKVKAIIIGCNNNGISYAKSIKEEYNKYRKSRKSKKL